MFSGRFITDINCDLGNTAAFLDFSPSNFSNPSALKIRNASFTRSGVIDSSDTTIIPNILNSDLESYWKDNDGIRNTHVGGALTVSSTSVTTVSATSTYYDIAGTWTASDLQHFDESANGRLRNLGNTPVEFRVDAILSIDGTANDVLKVNIRKYDSSSATFSDIYQQERKVNNLAGSRDVAQFVIIANVLLNINDYVILQVSNETSTDNVTAEIDSFFVVSER